MSTLLIATRNKHKRVELERILAAAGIGVELVDLNSVPPFDEAPETAPDFEGNALDKARDAVRATGLAAVADDSGLAVDALNGMPGVLSARWSGQHGQDKANLELLLAQVRDVPEERLGAAFVSAAALVRPDGQETVVRGTWPGRLVREPRGTNGFGYDPIFAPLEEPEYTAAELSDERKDELSHRGRALRELLPALRAFAES
ncbi:RdgB/HAM1 family non-canonical purine NTP pyrophosphatase [Sciscionella sediminilitoris]|uniref:RdgB/HAM1 family non-canonical purine NTP pyrophosphatase n=1 Tax=Sciscionella sediminilitoris TaxID=1445613 RepID=UPI0004DF8E3C|nr:RdgB/HAM1 family non-canonical purine NTP pyrophosphatase [Sciscionella sp. SE31]